MSFLSRFSAHPSVRRLLLPFVTVGGITAGAKLFSAVRDLMLAHRFGTQGEYDAYLIAYVVPAFAINIITGSIGAAVIPAFIEARDRQGKDAAQRLFSNTLICTAALLGIASVLLGVGFRHILPWIASSFTGEQAELTRTLFLIMLPGLMLVGLTSCCGAVLNACGRFAAVALAPILTPGLQLLFVFATPGRQITGLAIGTTVGAVVEAAVLIIALTRLGYSVAPRWYGMTPDTWVIVRQFGATSVGSVLMGSTLLVDQSMSAMLGRGSVSALAYGSKVVAVLRDIGPTAMSTVLLPHFSALVAAQSWDVLRRDLKLYTRIILAVAVPGTLAVVLLSKPIVALLFQRGAFTPSDTLVVSWVQSMFAMQIPFYMLGIMMVRVISSLKANHLLIYGTAISVVVNVVLNYVLMQWMGVAGIALSTSGVYLVSYIYLSTMVSRTLRRQEQSEGLVTGATVGVANEAV